MGQWALITGASEGIGRELARVFAEARWQVVLVARNKVRLQQLADELGKMHSTETAVVAADLAEPGAAASLFRQVSTRQIDALVNNAGFGSYGRFAETDLKLLTGMMQVNMTALVELTHLFLRPMLARGRGRILNVASTAAFQPGPTVNMYYATKAFVYSFSYALAEECAGTGVTVTTLCPGLTRTRFFDRARLQIHADWAAMDPRKVAELGFRGMITGRRLVIPGLLNRVGAFLAKRTPPRITGYFVRRLHRPMVKDQQFAHADGE